MLGIFHMYFEFEENWTFLIFLSLYNCSCFMNNLTSSIYCSSMINTGLRWVHQAIEPQSKLELFRDSEQFWPTNSRSKNRTKNLETKQTLQYMPGK